LGLRPQVGDGNNHQHPQQGAEREGDQPKRGGVGVSGGVVSRNLPHFGNPPIRGQGEPAKGSCS
ncbi:MAG: hypothetical protein ACRDVM_05815, partial [Acidimicrobiia bacterium]